MSLYKNQQNQRIHKINNLNLKKPKIMETWNLKKHWSKKLGKLQLLNAQKREIRNVTLFINNFNKSCKGKTK